MFELRSSQGAGGIWDGKDNITRSAWLDGSADYWSDTFAATQNQTAWTFSAWVRRTRLSQTMYLASAGSGGTRLYFSWQPDDTFLIQYSSSTNLTATPVWRDSEWQHIRWVWDTDNATAADRMRVYVNGVRVTFSANPTAGLTQGFNTAGASINVGRLVGAAGYYAGLMAQVAFLSGDVTSKCGEFTTVGTNGEVWTPISDAAMVALANAAGTNSFVMSSDIGDGTDDSANGNNLTANSMSDAANGSADVPSNPGTVWSVCQGGANGKITEGGLKVDPPYSATNSILVANLRIPATGKYYLEITPDGVYAYPGCYKSGEERAYYAGVSAGESFGFGDTTGRIYQNAGILSTLGAYAGGSVIMMAIDADAGEVYYGDDGTWIGSADPSAGTGAHVTGIDFANECWYVCVGDGGNNTDKSVITTLDADLAHSIPTNYFTFRLENFPAPSAQGIDHFNAVLFTGDATNNKDVLGANFQPDLGWHKKRSAVLSHKLFDSSRGVGNILYPDVPNAEAAETGIDSMRSDGVRVDNANNANDSAATYLLWLWKLNGGTTASNSDGSVATTVQVAEAGHMSIVQWTGTAGNATLGHGMDAKPDLVIVKNRTDSASWIVGSDMWGWTQYLVLDGLGGLAAHSTQWNGAPSAAVFKVGAHNDTNGSGDNMIAFCFRNKPGVCTVAQYKGNGAADGPLILTGNRIRSLLVKGNVGAQEWPMYDTVRSPHNPADTYVTAESNAGESVGGGSFKPFDILAHGFKPRTSSSTINGSGVDYYFLSMADVAAGEGLPPVPGR